MTDDTLDTSSVQSTGGVLLRLAWMAGVPFAMVCVLLLISEQTTQGLGVYDIALALLAVLAIVARAVDATYFKGTTARGEPATRRHVVGYAIRLIPAVTVGWLLSRTVAS